MACFLAALFLQGIAYSAAIQNTAPWLDTPVTVRFQNQPLSKVLEKISKQTGIAVLYDQELANEKVTGNYKGVKASDAITRLFNSENKSIQVDKTEKVIIIKTFGAKNFVWAGRDKGNNKSSKMTLAELEKLHEHQYKKYKERIADDNEVLEGGMTRREVRSMHEQQYRNFQMRLSNDDNMDEGSMTRQEIRQLQEKQYNDFQKRLVLSDDDVLESGVTRGETKAMHDKQYRSYQDRLASDSEVIDGRVGGGKIKDMHAHQYKEMKKKTFIDEQ